MYKKCLDCPELFLHNPNGRHRLRCPACALQKKREQRRMWAGESYKSEFSKAWVQKSTKTAKKKTKASANIPQEIIVPKIIYVGCVS